MARPARAVETQSRHSTKGEQEQRQFVQNQLKGANDKLIPPQYLTKNQKKIFKNIVGELANSEILGNVDVYILTTCSIAIDRLEDIERKINENPNLLTNSALMSSKDKYTKDLYRCCNELSLSPQARAKIGSLNIQKKKESADPILQLVRDVQNSA